MKRLVSLILSALVLASTPLCAGAAEVEKTNSFAVLDEAAAKAEMSMNGSEADSVAEKESPDKPTDSNEKKKDLPSELMSELKQKLGDVDNDEKITSRDSLLVLRASVNLEKADLEVADVDNDGRITSSDSLLILRHSVGFRDGYRIGLSKDDKVIEVSDISLDKNEVTIEAGKTVSLTAAVSPADAYDSLVQWTSNNESVATVKGGEVKAVNSGTATITAKTSNGKTASCKVTVFANPESVSLNTSEVSLTVGKTATLTATVSPDNASDKSITWTSSNTNVATVSDGTVKALKAGTATVTAKTKNGKTASCKVTVWNTVEVYPTAVLLSLTSMSLDVGKSAPLTATVSPNNATNKYVTWTSSNTNVATVSGGIVTAKNEGTATITAKTSNGKTAQCKVTVNKPGAYPTGVSLSQTSMSLNVDESASLTATVYPDSATNKSVTWTSSNTNVATVSGGTVTAKNEGTATITAETSNGKTAQCTVTVNKPVVYPTRVTLSQTSMSLDVGKSASLTATVYPDNATNKSVTWTSSNTNVAAVSGGTVTAKNAGTATITAETSNGKTAACTVTVKQFNTSEVENCLKLINYIKSNYDFTNSSGNKGIKDTPADGLTSAIVYDSSADKILFISSYEDYSSGKLVKSATTLTYDYRNGVVEDQTVNFANDYSFGYQADATWNAANVKYKGTISYSISNSINISNIKAQSLANNLRDIDLLSCGTVISVRTNISLADIGFTNYFEDSGSVAVTSVSLNKSSVSLSVGDTTTLSATVSPTNATDKSVTWTTSNSSVATVSNGTVKAVKAGTATITAKTSNGKTATCTVTVTGTNNSNADVRANCEKLKNYILKNYDESDYNYKLIKYNGSNGDKVYIQYWNNKDIITFAYNYSGSYGVLSVNMEYHYDTGSVGHSIFRNAGVLKMYDGHADFKASSLRKDQILNYDFHSIMGYSQADAQTNADELRDNSVKIFNAFLNSRTGLTMNDIGFTSYDLS